MATLVLLITLVMLCRSGVAFNVDTLTAVIHEGAPHSMFGYSVAQHTEHSTHWILVGAPRMQTSQRDVKNGGAVYRCRARRSSDCLEIPFDPEGNEEINYRGNLKFKEHKSDQWLGATVQSAGKNGPIVACAPRYIYTSIALDKLEPVGVCYVISGSSSEPTAISPCKASVDKSLVSHQYHKRGFCQAGFSASFTDDGNKLLVGAVGSWYWQGQVYLLNIHNSTDILFTREQSPPYDNTLMGYSAAVGNFNGDKHDGFVVSIPRAANYSGEVVILNYQLQDKRNITGEQIGSYFGSAVAVSDLNNDGRDDVIVGAPYYSSFIGTEFDTGRVYIYYQTPSHQFTHTNRDVLDGNDPGSHFGAALASLGDINLDTYNDIAVGAPYGGENGMGVVYIFHGSVKGVITEVSQAIQSTDVAPGLAAFGCSLSGGLDQDNNDYPDLVVGAFRSDKAIFLKTRPVVRVYASLRIHPTDIDLQQKNCELIDGTAASCFVVYSCLEYDGIGVPNELYFDVSLELDVIQRNLTVDEQRAFFINTIGFKETVTHKLSHAKIMCTDTNAYMKSEPLDKLTPVAVELRYKLHDKESGRRRRSLLPVLDQYIPSSIHTEAQIEKNCGEDKKCIPNLSLYSFRRTAAHIIGSGMDLEITVNVENSKEDAFNTKLYVTLPIGITFKNKAGVKSVVPVACETLENMIICDLGNPLPHSQEVSFTLWVSAHEDIEAGDVLTFAMIVNSTNPEDTADVHDNTAVVEVPVTASANITIYGRSEPDQVILNASKVTGHGADDLLPVVHLYQLRNLGPSDTKEIQMQVLWPSHDRRGNVILELDGQPQLNGSGLCNVHLITPDNATKYGYTQQGAGKIQVVLPSEQDEFKSQESGESMVVTCGRRRCTVIQCLVRDLKADGNFLLNIRSRLHVRSIVRMRNKAKIFHIRSSVSARIDSLPYNLSAVDIARFPLTRHSIMTTVHTDHLKPFSKEVDVWIFIVSVSAGLLLLLLLILLLWFCGFFKRKKPEDDSHMVSGVRSSNVEERVYE